MQKQSLLIFSNPRFYILVASVLLSISAASLLRIQIPSDQLFSIRTQQVFGYLCVLYWYVALLISPLKQFGNDRPWYKSLVFCRRAIGVSAFYFALLHVMIAVWGQIGGPAGLLLLPERFVWAVALGFTAFAILFVMAATSFNKVIAFMTFKRWKWLHRLGYIGGIFVMIHLWIIGTHSVYLNFRSVLFVLLSGLLALEAHRAAGLLVKRRLWTAQKRTIITVFIWLFGMGLLLLIPSFISSSNDHHTVMSGRMQA